MSLPAPLSIADEAVVLQQVLLAWAKPKGGDVKIMSSLAKFWQTLFDANDQPLLLICYTGDKSRGDDRSFSALHRVDRAWTIAVIRGTGFVTALAEPSAQQIALYDVVEIVRDEVRKILNISEEFPVEYRGTSSLPQIAPSRDGSVFLDGFALEFTTAHDIPEIALE